MSLAAQVLRALRGLGRLVGLELRAYDATRLRRASANHTFRMGVLVAHEPATPAPLHGYEFPFHGYEAADAVVSEVNLYASPDASATPFDSMSNPGPGLAWIVALCVVSVALSGCVAEERKPVGPSVASF